MSVKLACLMVVGAICSYTDIKNRLIYDKATIPAALVGICLNAFAQGWEGFLDSLGGLALGFGISFVAAAWGAYGGGDVKMTAAFGAIGGTRFILYCMLYTAVIEGLVSTIMLARRKQLAACISAIWQYWSLALAGEKASLPSFGSIPHAPWLTLGALLAVVLPL